MNLTKRNHIKNIGEIKYMEFVIKCNLIIDVPLIGKLTC